MAASIGLRKSAIISLFANQKAHSMRLMYKLTGIESPTIKTFSNRKINMYFADHLPPRFHVIMSDDRAAQLKIENNKLMRTDIKAREIREALEWAKTNRGILRRKWKEFQQ